MAKNYRNGAIGALMDEYERAALELKILLNKIPPEDFVKIVDPNTKDEDCRSIQSIMNHVVRAGYGYSNYLRKEFGINSDNRFIKSTMLPRRFHILTRCWNILCRPWRVNGKCLMRR